VPIARYFMVVGSALLALLLIAGWSLPELPSSFLDRPQIISRANIRIKSAHKWPERIVLDTSQPTIPTPSIEVVTTEQLIARLPDEMTDQARAAPWSSQVLMHDQSTLIAGPPEPGVSLQGRFHRRMWLELVVTTSPQDGARTRSVVGLSGRQQYQELHRASVSRVGTPG
jgi:hypothetical protein